MFEEKERFKTKRQNFRSGDTGWLIRGTMESLLIGVRGDTHR